MKKPNKVDQVVFSFGGTGAMAELCRVTSAAVSQWRHDGLIPERHHYRISEAAKRRDIEIDASVFEAQTV